MIKVYDSYIMEYVINEGVQINGGYGYHQDYAVERAYRDSRINRLFEGTNEINRLLVTGMLLRRGQRGRLPLLPAALQVVGELTAPPSGEAPSTGVLDEERRLVSMTKKVVLFTAGVAVQKF